MGCEHKRLRCTDNRYFCLDCKAEVKPVVKTEEKPKKTRRKGEAK